jgi:predicted O-methyltransferase YrrM
MQPLKILAKKLLYRTPYGRLFAHRFAYNFTPRQLCFLAGCLDRTAHLSGAALEIGCFVGLTTIWLNKHMDAEGIRKPYIALDTFSGFVPSQVEHETEERGKDGYRTAMRAAFSTNSKAMFDRQLEWNGLSRVRSIEADAATFDYSTLGPLSFALIDVDLYIPVKAALERVYALMQPGGIIVVDDCASDQIYDGALQAYDEFTRERGLKPTFEHRKLGVIEI